jgi:hypothetical protein
MVNPANSIHNYARWLSRAALAVAISLLKIVSQVLLRRHDQPFPHRKEVSHESNV